MSPPRVSLGWDQVQGPLLCPYWSDVEAGLYIFLATSAFRGKGRAEANKDGTQLSSLSWETKRYLVQPLRKGRKLEGGQEVIDLSRGEPAASG